MPFMTSSSLGFRLNVAMKPDDDRTQTQVQGATAWLDGIPLWGLVITAFAVLAISIIACVWT